MMRRFIDGAEHIYLACGATDFRKQIPGLSTLVRSRFHLDPFQGSSVFIFCNKKRDVLQALRHAQKKIYGPSSEKMSQQMSLFEENEKQIAFAKELNQDLESVTVTKKERKRNSHRMGIRAEMLNHLDLKVVEYTLPEDATCLICGGALKPIGRKVLGTHVEYEKAKLSVVQTVQWVEKCTQCGSENSDNPNDHFEVAPVPKPLIPKSMVSASLMAEIMHQKFVLGVPFARQEKEWYRLGVNLHRSEISRLTIRVCEKWLKPLYQRIHEELLSSKVLHMDEMRIQCNKEPGKALSSDSYMWVMCSEHSEERQAVYFQYVRSRSRERAKSLLSGFHGYLMTDAYEAYNKIEGDTWSLCWAHVRRKFVDSIPLDSQKREIPGSAGTEGESKSENSSMWKPASRICHMKTSSGYASKRVVPSWSPSGLG